MRVSKAAGQEKTVGRARKTLETCWPETRAAVCKYISCVGSLQGDPNAESRAYVFSRVVGEDDDDVILKCCILAEHAAKGIGINERMDG